MAAIDTGKYDLIVLNFANPDMVGHTGSLPAAIKAVETVDAGLGRIVEAVRQQGGALLVTADHGNCELMKDPETGGPHTAHTTNPVPVVLVDGARARHPGRHPGRRRAHAARPDGPAAAARDDRPHPDPPRCGARRGVGEESCGGGKVKGGGAVGGGETTGHPLPSRAWAAKRTKDGGRGPRGADLFDPSRHPWSASRPKPSRGGGVPFSAFSFPGLRLSFPGLRPSVLLLALLALAAAAPHKEHATRAQREAAEQAHAAEIAAQQQAAARAAAAAEAQRLADQRAAAAAEAQRLADQRAAAAAEAQRLADQHVAAAATAAEAQRLADQRAAAAAAAAAEAQRLSDQRIAAAARLQQAEAATEAAANRMADLQRRRREAAAQLAVRAHGMQPLLPVIERLSLYPAETLLAVPAAPEDTLRGLIVLQGLARQLQQDSAALRQSQASLDAATAAVAAETPKLAAAEAVQEQEGEVLDQQIAAAQADQTAAQTDADAAAARAAEAATQADTLRAMLVTLDAQRRADAEHEREAAVHAGREKRTADAEADRDREAALTPFSGGTLAAAAQPDGQLTAPVAGTVFRSWGDPTDAGPATGISYHAAPSARVVSPCNGRVSFAESFRSYGLLLIVDCGGGYHAVLAGFERLDVKAGQDLRAGEPVGVMPGWNPGAGSRPSLYVELRHGEQPVNPAPWLKASS